MALRKCKNCALVKDSICRLFNEPIDPEQCCPKFTEILYECEMCGKPLLPNQVVITLDKNIDRYRLICMTCAVEHNQCKTCRYSSSCMFETDPSSTPKTVNKTVSQGNMTSYITVPNPDRIEEICNRKNCPCFDQKIGCKRQNHGCVSWEANYKNA